MKGSTPKTKRDNFTPATRRIIAGRAAYRCSFPGCERETIGPGPRPDTVTCLGCASHIFAAVEGGPRGTGGYSAEERKSAKNGIWLCRSCGDMVDKDDGVKYPASLLLAYKQRQEAVSQLGLDAIAHPRSFWLQSIVFVRNALFAEGEVLRFGKVTLIVGEVGSGKSTLALWLEGLGRPDQIAANERRRGRQDPFAFALRMHTPQSLDVSVEWSPSAGVSFGINREDVAVCPFILRVVHLRSNDAYEREYPDEAPDGPTVVARRLGCTVDELTSVVRSMPQEGYGLIRRAAVVEDEGGRRLLVQFKGQRQLREYPGQHSSYETLAITVTLAIELARWYSRFGPALLVIDHYLHYMGEQWYDILARLLSMAPFQTIVMLQDSPHQWGGWMRADLIGNTRGVRVKQ